MNLGFVSSNGKAGMPFIYIPISLLLSSHAKAVNSDIIFFPVEILMGSAYNRVFPAFVKKRRRGRQGFLIQNSMFDVGEESPFLRKAFRDVRRYSGFTYLRSGV